MANPKIAVIGAGGIGGLLADALGRNGHDVLLCVRTPIQSLRIEHDGVIREVPARIATDASSVFPVDWVVLATKAQDTASAAPWLHALVGPATKVVISQNGVDHADRVRPFAGDAEILPMLVYAAVERVEPGFLEQHSGNRVVLPKGECSTAFALLLKGSELAVEQIDDFRTAAWRKLLSNVAANPITALTMRRMDVMHEPGIRGLAKMLLLEAIATGRAAGAHLEERDADDVLALHDTYDVRGGTSMLYDRLAGRPLEHEYLAGAIVHYAEIHGVPVPLNRAILTLLRALH